MTTFIYKYKRMARTVAMSLGICTATFTLTGCSDFLETLPLNEQVLENFWTQKADVNSVLTSCYESLESEESILRMGIWGELRSDNLVRGRQINNDLSDILKENLLPTNQYTKWEVMYRTINRCNTVCHYAPGVAEIDPNYSQAEMKANIAEAVFIRNLCYFYLVRTFRDIPMSYEPSIDDSQQYEIEPKSMNDALDAMIADMEAVQEDAVLRYIDDSRMTNSTASSSAYENSSRVTRVAMYALLADLHLWRGNWQKSVEYCDKVIAFKKEQYALRKNNLGDSERRDMVEMYDDIPLIRDVQDGSTTAGNAYEEIFYNGNSFESIFELYFLRNQNTRNNYVANYYGSSDQPLGNFAAPTLHFEGLKDGSNKFFNKDDYRAYALYREHNSRYTIRKYVNSSITVDPTKLNQTTYSPSVTVRGDAYANWIIYRLTDIMLIKAEALVQMGEDNYEEAFNLIDAVNRRARNLIATNTGALKMADYVTSREKMEKLILDERNRELMFEGKRWFDLVRFALRNGSNQVLIDEATIKYEDNVNAIKIKLADPNMLFYPYNRDELKLNRYLKQNPAYGDTEDFIK